MAINRMATAEVWLGINLLMMTDAIHTYLSPDQDEMTIRYMVEFADGQKVEIIVQDAT